MSLQQVADGCRVPLDALYSVPGLPEDAPASVLLRELVARVEGFTVGGAKTAAAELPAQIQEPGGWLVPTAWFSINRPFQ